MVGVETEEDRPEPASTFRLPRTVTPSRYELLVAPDLAFLRSLVDRAEGVVAEAGSEGITVSAFREALGTSRKYALPLLAWFDQRGLTRRSGDLRFPRS